MRKIATLFIITIFTCLTAFGNGNSIDGTSSQKRKKAQPDLPGTVMIDLGFNMLLDESDSLDLGIWGSKGVNIYYMYDIPLGDSKLSFNPGFGVGLEKYSFDANYSLTNTPDGTVDVVPATDIVGSGLEIKKSKIAANYFDIPLSLTYRTDKDNPKKGMRFSIGGKIGLLFSSHTKIKYKNAEGDNAKLKSKDDFNINRFRYGAHVKAGSRGFNVFFYYGLSELFESNKGPQKTTATPIMFGISIASF